MYLLAVSDKNFGAEPQTGFAVMPKQPVPDKNFTLRPVTVIQGRVTVGKDQKPRAPAAGQAVELGDLKLGRTESK